MYEGSLEPECIEAYYDALGKENTLEWSISLTRWYHFQPIIALFGYWYAIYAAICAFYFLIYPDRLPSIEDAPWDDLSPRRARAVRSVTTTAVLMQPDAFFWSQVFTFGQSDLKDLELIYMSPFDAVTYFILEAVFLPYL